MTKKKVLITGATGFVGNRLAERMSLSGDYDVSVLIHRFTGPGLARIARLPVKFVEADLLASDSLEQATSELDIIIHMAYGTSGDDAQRMAVTVDGTENIMKLGLKKNVQKVIHFSTAAVYGQDPGMPIVTESAEFQRSKDVYRESKIKAEEVVWNYHSKHGLPVVVFRPPLIYGPYGAFWTARILKEIQEGAILVNNGDGQANIIYVDNLIDAVFLALNNTDADGEGFILVDDDGLTWRKVYEAYAAKLDAPPPFQYKTVKEIDMMRKGDYPNDLKSWVVKPFLLVPEIVQTCFRSDDMRQSLLEVPWLRFFKEKISRPTLKEWKKSNGNTAPVKPLKTIRKKAKIPGSDIIELYASTARFSNEKAKEVLDYRQRISFQKALDSIFEWFHYQWLIR